MLATVGAMSAWRTILRKRDDSAPSLYESQARRSTIANPFSESQLQKIVFADILGVEDFPVTRDDAMGVPAVAKARHLVTGICRQPIKAYLQDEPLATQPVWMYRTNGNVPPQMRMLWTLDDLYFYGWSLWAVQRGTKGQILDAMRVPYEWWTIDPDTHDILVRNPETGAVDVPATPESVILIPGPFEGLLLAGERTIKAARNLEQAWARRVRLPVPAVELHQMNDDQLEDSEITKTVDSWGAMMEQGGGVAFTPHQIEMRSHGSSATDLFIEGRNAVTLDIGRMTNVPAMMLDASMATSSLQYVTAVDGRNSFIDITIAYWTMTIEARLSMDDVLPRGQRAGFDLSNLTALPQPAAGPASED